MKNTKKKVLVGALALSLVAIVGFGSLAWYQASDSVKNKFLVASSTDPDDPEDDTFSIKVTENVPDHPDNEDDFTYPVAEPGAVLQKQPYAVNTGKYDQYVRVIVKVSDAQAWTSVLTNTAYDAVTADQMEAVTLDQMVQGFNTTGFAYDAAESGVADDTFTFVFYGNGILPAGERVRIFDTLTIPGTLTNDQANKFSAQTAEEKGFTVDVKAQAVQTENVGSNAKEAFATVGMSIND